MERKEKHPHQTDEPQDLINDEIGDNEKKKKKGMRLSFLS